jgi:hypothetical protein
LANTSQDFSDSLAVESLISQGLIDREFVADVLALDLTNPLFSWAPCGLLRLAPEKADVDWQKKFQSSLKSAAPNNPAAKELFDNLNEPAKEFALSSGAGKEFHRSVPATFAKRRRRSPNCCGFWLKDPQRSASEISKFPTERF